MGEGGSLTGALASEGGSRWGALASFYHALEDRYYGLMDWLEERGVKVYEFFVYPLEQRGFPSFPVAALILLCAIAFLAFLLYPRPAAEVDFNLRVFNGTKAVDGALVEVYLPGDDGGADLLLISGKTAGGGSVVFYGVPARLLRFTASKDGDNATDLIDASRINGRLDFAFKPPVPSRPSEGGLSSTKTTRAPKLQFQPANVFDNDKQIGKVPLILKATPTPDANSPVPSTPPAPPSADKGQVTVEIRDASSGSPIAASASVSLIDAITLQKVSTSSSQSGSAAFNGIAYGSTLFAQVSAAGYLPYDGLSAGEVFYVNSPSRTITIMLSPASGADAVSASIIVRNRASGAPLSATLRLFRQDASLPEYEGVVAGTKQFVLKKNAVYSAEASASGFSPATKSFTADGTDVVVELDAIATPIPNAVSCQVVAPSSGTAGSPVQFRVLYTGVPTPPTSASFSCSLSPQPPVPLSCVSIGPNAGSCSASCTYLQAGSFVATASGIAKGVSCTAPAAVVISAVGAPSPRHSVCSADKCVEVDGAGPNSCSADSGCLGKHNACGTSGSCVVVAGRGEATCETSAQCAPSQAGKRHSVCSNNACVSVEGEGFEECSLDSQCEGVHSDCSSGKCVASPGPGDARCQADGQCVAPPPGQSCSDGTAKGACSAINAGARCSSSLVLLSDSTCPSPASSCSDGTSLSTCSTTMPLYCDGNGILNPNSAKCGCPGGYSAAADGILCTPQAPASKCPDGTPAGQCTSILPFQCTADGSSYAANAAKCGCPGGFVKSGDSCAPIENACSDGSLRNSCSSTKPFFCDSGGDLALNAAKCGCPAGAVPDSKGVDCAGPPKEKCDDGTARGQCTSNKPLACRADGSGYSELASLCGCPSGFVQSGDSCVEPGKACSDGTSTSSCSTTMPLYCDGAGVLHSDSAKCGCPSGYTRDSSGVECTPVGQVNSCPDGTPKGACTKVLPFQCSLDGSSYAENSAKCGCPAGFEPSGSSCVPSGASCSDGTASGVCSGVTKGYQCTREGEGYFLELNSQCGCPVGWKLFAGACHPPELRCGDGTPLGSCTTVLANMPLYCGIAQGNTVPTLYSNASASCGCPAGWKQKDGLCIECADNSCGELSGVPHCALGGFNYAAGSCIGISQPLFCTPGGNLVKKSDPCGCPAGKVPDSKGVDCVAGIHEVAPSCLLDLDPNSPNLGSVANTMAQYTGLAEPAGAGANQPSSLACGRIDGAAIPPLSPLACKGGSGTCATQCAYPQSVDLARNGNADQAATLSVGPPDANAQCAAGFSFLDRPAAIRVKATHQTPVGSKPVPTAQVTLLRIDSGSALLCASQAADENGEAVFGHCTDSGGKDLYSLLEGDRVEAAVAYKDGSGTTLLGGKGAVALSIPSSLGENSLAVSLDAPYGIVAASVVDAVTGRVTPDLKSASFTLACQEPLLASQGVADFFVVGKCSGSECAISAPAFVECRLFAKAPNYFDSSDILVPRIKSQADRQAVAVSLIPKSFGGASMMVLDGVYDLGRGTAIPAGGEIFKSFDYVAKATLKSLRRSDGGAGAFFQTGVERDDCSHSEACIFGATADPNYPLWAKGGYYIDEQCSNSDLDFGSGPEKNLFKWADINSINDVNGVPYSGQFLYSFRTSENSPATSLPLLYRSYVVDGGRYTLSPYDADVLFANKPLCMANANSAVFNFASSQKACNDDKTLCLAVTFSQASSAQNGARGDGFAALSNSRCLSGTTGSVNPSFCQPLLASFEIEDANWQSIRKPYKLSFSFPSANLKASKAVFSSFDNAELVPSVSTRNGISSFAIDVGKEFYDARHFPPRQFIRGYVVSDPLATAPRADLTFGYSTAAASATRKTWISVVENPNAVSKYSEGRLDSFSQDEQAGFTTDGSGNTVMRSPFTRADSLPPSNSDPDSAPYASLDDCSAPFAGASGGWDCTPFKVKFSFTAFQPADSATLAFSIDKNFLGLRSLSYSILDNVGNKKADGVATISQDGASASSSIPSIEAGDSITATAELDAIKPTDAAGKAKFAASFTNGPPEQGGTLALESFVTIKPSYGVVKFVASDESTGNAVKASSSPLVSAALLDSIKVASACRQGASPNACSFRITSLPVPIEGALSASATASGYFDSAPQLFPSSVVQPGTTFATAPTVSIPLIPLAQDTMVSISSISDAESGEVVCSTAGVKCDDPAVFLPKGRKYKAHLTAGFRAGSSRVGVAVAAEPFNSGAALIYDSSRKFSYAATSLPTDNYRGGPAADSTCDSAGISTDGNAFFKAVAPEQGLGWLEISADSKGKDISGKALDADVFFFVPDGTSASSFTLGFRSFAIVKDANGVGKYLRYPFDSDLGLNRDSASRFSCQAKAQSLSLKLNLQGDTCSQDACLRVAKYSQVKPSGSEDENAGQPGFEAVSRDDWLKWANGAGFTLREPQPLKVLFAINLLKALPAKSKLSFRIDDKHLEFGLKDGLDFDIYCGNGVDAGSAKKKILPGSKSSPFEIDLSDCPDFTANPDFQGTLYLWPTAPNDNAAPTSPISISVGPASSPTALSSFVKVVPAVTSSPFALIQTPQVRQRHAPSGAYSSGLDSQYLSVGECLNPAYSKTDSKEGLQKVQNTYDGVSLNIADNSCHSGYIELKFDITSQVTAPKSSLKLAIAPKVASDGDGLFVSKIVASRESTGFVAAKDFPFGTKTVSLDKPAFLDNLASGERFSLTALLLPRAAMKKGFSYEFSFDNGEAAPTAAKGEVKYVDAVTYSPAVKVGEVRPIFCGGNAALFFKADSNTQGATLPRSGCDKITMMVDSIFPADGIPIELESSYLTACSQSLDAKLYAFLPPLDAKVPDLSRSLSIEKIGGQYVLKFDATASTNGGPFVRGNSFLKNGKPMPPGDGVLGGARLSMLCRIENKEDAKVNITVVKQEINGVNAIDGSYIAFKGQAHELAYTLYNGQFPMSLTVEGHAKDDGSQNTRQYSFNPEDSKANKRLNYWLVRNSKLPKEVQTYPLNFYPDGGTAKVSDGISINSPDDVVAYRPGSWLQRVVALAHQDKNTLDLQNAFLSEPSKVCNAINYVANGVMYQVPLTFPQVAMGIARTSAFRRSPAALGQWWCAPRADTHEYSCYPNVDNWINTSIVQTFGSQAACIGCTDISEDAPLGGSFGLKLLDSKGVEITPSPYQLSDGSSKSFLQLPEAATSFTASSGVDAQSVSLEFKRPGSPVCPTKASDLRWCGIADVGEKFLNKYDSGALSLQKSDSGWSASFDAYPNGDSDGPWMVRLKATDADGLSTYSKAVILAVTLKSRACHPSSSNGRQCSLSWCDPQCSPDGTKREVVSAGPLKPDDKDYWLNESELKLDSLVPCGEGQTSNCVQNIGKYSGAPFKYFIPDRNFTLSLPLIAWGWQVPNLQASYRTKSEEMCTVGMGAYELKLSSKAGDDVEYTIALSRLPTKNYLLYDETSDTAELRGTQSGESKNNGGYDPSAGVYGCSIKTERKYPDWGGGSDWIVTGEYSTFSPKQWRKDNDNKWLCNVVPVHVDKHHHDGGGLMDCLKYCSKEYCGNCGKGNVFCPIPTAPQVNQCVPKPGPTPLPAGYSGYCSDQCDAFFDESTIAND